MAIHHNDFGGVGINATLEIAQKIARRSDHEVVPDQPVDFAGLARMARNSQVTHQTPPSVSRRATQPIPCPEPNVG
ncbi:MAG: hypothetical protein HY862_08795 [Chloroflexi bacterium]|nr:hypothetical protein [Chloroflexota bacterium]